MKHSSLQSHFSSKIEMKFRHRAIEHVLPSPCSPSPSAFPHSFFISAQPPQEGAGELLLTGRALWSCVHPRLSRTHTSHSLEPLKAHAPACSHGSLKRSGVDKNEQSAVCSSLCLPFVSLPSSPPPLLILLS